MRLSTRYLLITISSVDICQNDINNNLRLRPIADLGPASTALYIDSRRPVVEERVTTTTVAKAMLATRSDEKREGITAIEIITNELRAGEFADAVASSLLTTSPTKANLVDRMLSSTFTTDLASRLTRSGPGAPDLQQKLIDSLTSSGFADAIATSLITTTPTKASLVDQMLSGRFTADLASRLTQSGAGA
jgi:hypothetical protein